MADPVTWAWIALGVSAVGTGVATYSSVQQAQAQEKLAKAQAQRSEVEAISRLQAAEFEERQFRRRAALALGKMRAISTTAGLDIASGSPLFAELDAARQAEIEALNIRRTGAVGASAAQFEARLDRFRARVAREQIPGIIAGGISDIAGRSASILSSWMGARRRTS